MCFKLTKVHWFLSANFSYCYMLHSAPYLTHLVVALKFQQGCVHRFHTSRHSAVPQVEVLTCQLSARANFFRLFGDSPSLPAPRLVSVHRPAPVTPAYFLLVRVVLTLQGSLAKDYFTGGLTAGKCSSSFAPEVVNSSKQIKQTNNGTRNKSRDVPYQCHPTLMH